MSKEKLETILVYIDDVEYIVAHYGGVTNTLNDRIGKHSLLMCLMQIGEKLNKIKTTNKNLLEAKKGAYNTRNFIAYDYEGVNLALIENIVRNLLKPLKNEILKEIKNQI